MLKKSRENIIKICNIKYALEKQGRQVDIIISNEGYHLKSTNYNRKLYEKILKKRKMKTLIIGQIHDSIVSDVVESELEDYLQIVKKVMTEDIRKHWPWIIVPLTVEAEASPVNGNWYEKKEIIWFFGE